MIFVSLGTMDMPFYRMAKTVDEWAATTDEEVVVQTGYTDYEYKNIKKVFRFCTKDEMQGYIIPQYQMATLDEIEQDLKSMKEVYNSMEVKDDSKGNEN